MKKKLLQSAIINRRASKRIAPLLPAEEHAFAAKHSISVCEPDIGAKELRYVQEAVKSNWISSGSFVEKFERAFAKTVSKTKYAIAVNSGTSAIHVSLAVLGIGVGDEIIMPAFTMIATANAVSQTGARPVLVDADPNTWNIAPGEIERKITKRTKAIIAVHIYGLPADMEAIGKLSKKYQLWVVEDAAEAQGAEYKGKRTGSIGDVAAFSLYANKIITTGEGGMVTTNNRHIAERAYLLRNHAFSRERHFWHRYLGYGYKMSDLQAAVGLAQVEGFRNLSQARRRNAKLYIKLLSRVKGLTLPQEPARIKNAYWMFGIITENEFSISKDKLRAHLAKKGIETRSFFIPIHLQPVYYDQFKNERFPVAERLCRDGLYLPSASTLTPKQIEFICQQVRRAPEAKR